MRKTALAVVPLLLVVAAPARADIVVITGVDNSSTDNVLFADQSASSTILGSVGAQTDVFQVTGATALGGNLLSSDSSTGTIAGSGSDLTSLTLALVGGGTFDKIVFDINAAADGSVNFLVLEGSGATTQFNFFVGGTGQNPFTFSAINGQTIQSLSMTGAAGATITSVRGFRVGGLSNVAAVPETTTWAMMLLGFGAVGFALRHSKKVALQSATS